MYSMTAFASSLFELCGHIYALEIRSVNSRYLEVSIHLPWTKTHELEHQLRSALKRWLSRGRIELSVSLMRITESAKGATLDETRVQQLGKLLQAIMNALSCDMNTAALLLGPAQEMLIESSRTDDTETIWPILSVAMNEAMERLQEMRLREGQALEADISRQLILLQNEVDEIEARTQDEPERQRARLMEKITQLGEQQVGQIDPARMAIEVAYYVERSQIHEEITRIKSHIVQFRSLMASQEPIGRKGDFLLQEFHRELNTIGSKTALTEITHRIVDAKSWVEKMREQIQNIE